MSLNVVSIYRMGVWRRKGAAATLDAAKADDRIHSYHEQRHWFSSTFYVYVPIANLPALNELLQLDKEFSMPRNARMLQLASVLALTLAAASTSFAGDREHVGGRQSETSRGISSNSPGGDLRDLWDAFDRANPGHRRPSFGQIFDEFRDYFTRDTGQPPHQYDTTADRGGACSGYCGGARGGNGTGSWGGSWGGSMQGRGA